MSSELFINALAQGVSDTSATQHYRAGSLFKDESGNVFQYGYFSAYCSAYMTVTGYEESSADPNVLKFKKATAVSTIIGAGIVQQNVAAGYWAFVQKYGVGAAYVTSSVAAELPLQLDVANAGQLMTPTGSGTMQTPCAKALATGAGSTVATSVLILCLNN